MTKAVLERKAGRCARPQAVVEELGPITAMGLRHVQRGVGLAKELFGLCTWLSERDARADSLRDLRPFDVERRTHHLDEPAGNPCGLGRVAHFSGEHHELIATDTSDEVAGTHGACDPQRDLAKHLIAGGMAK